MDISDEELFDATPSCSTSTTNTSLNLIEQINDLTPDSVQQKNSNNVVTKDILVKLTRLPNASVKRRQTDSHSSKRRRKRYWKFGNIQGRFYKTKKASSFTSLKSLQQLRNMEPAVEATLVPSKDRENEEPRTYSQSYAVEESESNQKDEQAAQSKTESFVLSTCEAQEEEDSYADKTYVCARTLPYKFHYKGGRISDDGTIVKSTASSFSLPSNSKNIENLHSDSLYLSNCPSSSNTKTKKQLIRSRLEFMVKRMQLNDWKFKRKYISSDDEIEELSIIKKKRSGISNDSDNKTSVCNLYANDASVSNAKAIEDNNRSESHLSLKKIAKKKTDVQINPTARVTLTRLEEMKDEDIIKWRESKTKSSDVIDEPVEEQQLDRQKLSQNLITLEPQDKLILPKKHGFLETKDTPPVTTPHAEKHCTKKSKLNKLREKYKLFKKPRVLMIKLDTLQCSSKDGMYSATEVECLTKNYYVINSFVTKKSRKKSIKQCYVQKAYTMLTNTDAENIAEDYNTSLSVSRRQNTNEIPEESSTKDTQTIENSDENVPFKIHRKFASIQNQGKSLSGSSSLSENRLEIWRNAFRTLITTGNLRTASMQLESISNNYPILPKKSVDAKSESALPSTSASSTKHNTSVGSPKKQNASPKKQTEVSAKPTERNDTSKSESSVSSKNLPSNANVDKIISMSDLSRSKDSTVSKSPCKSAKETDVFSTSNTSLNSSKKISEMSPKLHEKVTNLELATSGTTNNASIKSKSTSEVRDVESPNKKVQTHRCLCKMSFENQDLLLKHIADQAHICTLCKTVFTDHNQLLKHMTDNLNNKTCAVVSSTSSNTSKSVESVSMPDETLVNKNHSKSLKNSKPSTLQKQRSSVNGEGNSHQLNVKSIDSALESVIDIEIPSSSVIDIEIPSSSSSSSSSRVKTREHFKRPHKKLATKSGTKSKSDLKLDSSNKAKILESNRSAKNVKRSVICKICLRVFDTYAQLLHHMFKHMADDLRSMYMSIENEIATTHQESSENNVQISDNIGENLVGVALGQIEVSKNGINEQEKRPSENTNEPSAGSLITSKVSQSDATKEGNKALNLSAAEHTVEQNSQKQSTPAANNTEQNMEKGRTERVAKSSSEHQPTFIICECHRPKTNKEYSETKLQIEIVLLCTTCQTLFRRFECFEAHCTQRSAESMLCNKNRRLGRKSRLLCVSCQQVMGSIQELCQHLIIHFQRNRTSKATFRCNICKVVFYNLGHLFDNHFQNHQNNPFFLASRLSFPRPSYLNSKLLRLPLTDNNKTVEVYMQVADHVCNDCRLPFDSAQSLISHKAVCVNVTNKSTDPRNGSRNSISNKIPIILVCGFCSKTFYSKMAFNVHSLEHTQKKNMHMHYTCVAVTAITKVYICKVCTTMWQSIENFENHWKTHNALREDYICSRCHSNYCSFDMFQEHVLIHKNNNEIQQVPITCEVIYRDVADPNSQKEILDDLPYMDLSCFEKYYAANDKSREPLDLTCSQDLVKTLFGNRSTQEAVIELSSRSNEELATRTLQIPVQVPSSNVAVAQSNRSSENNSRNVNDDSDEEELTIVLSESEESSVSNGIRRSTDKTPPTKKNTQENTKSMSVIDEQTQSSNAAAASAKTSNDVNESTNASKANKIPVHCISIGLMTEKRSCTSVGLMTETQNDDANIENSRLSDVDHSDVNSSRGELKETLPENAMSSIPKSFLRVKSLAELTNDPSLKNHFCRVCGMSFETQHRLRGHMSICSHYIQLSRQKNQGSQISSSDNIQVCPPKPTDNSLVSVPATSTQDPLPSVAAIDNVSPSVSVSQKSQSPRLIDTCTISTKSGQYQVIGVKPLNSADSNKIANVSKPKETLPREVTRPLNNDNTSQHNPQKTAYHQNLPPYVKHPKKSTQSTQQQQSAAVKPFSQTPYQVPRPPLTSYLQQQQQLQHVLQQSSQVQQSPQLQQQPQQLQQPPQVQQSPQLQQQSQFQQLQQSPQVQQQPQLQQLQQSPQLQQQSQMQQLQQPQLQQLQQSFQQQFQQHLQQQHPQQLQQQLPQQQQPQQLHQQLQQQQSQQLQQQLQQSQQLQQQLHQQLQQNLQLQQQQSQQQTNIDNVMHYVVSKTDMSYRLTSSNMMPANADNVVLVAVNAMQQISKDPDRYICLYCPGFECGSVQQFASHEHSPKHEARSHYNGVAFVPRT